MNPFTQSRIDHPDLPLRIVLFFALNRKSASEDKMPPFSVSDFLSDYNVERPRKILQPSVLVEICRRLIRQGWLTEVSTRGPDGVMNRYASVISGDHAGLDQPGVSRIFSCAVYGFPAVYDFYANSVLPVINWNPLQDQQIGTAFVFNPYGVVTALHCITPAAAFALQGVLPSQLQRARFFKHPNDDMDIAIILFDEPVFTQPPIPFPATEADILDEVMALGYPNVPGYMPTLAAEAAQVAGRLTATRGRVASKPMEIFAKSELFLVTARVRGGFSGGPLLDAFGQLVGIVSREPAADANPGEGQRYDELGYGTAIPSARAVELFDVVKSQDIKPLCMSGVEMRQFL